MNIVGAVVIIFAAPTILISIIVLLSMAVEYLRDDGNFEEMIDEIKYVYRLKKTQIKNRIKYQIVEPFKHRRKRGHRPDYRQLSKWNGTGWVLVWGCVRCPNNAKCK